MSSGSTSNVWKTPEPREPAPELRVYNSFTRNKELFVPQRGRLVTWYNCGPTVYDASHMGHARNYVTQDIIRRIMRDYLGYDIQFVMNVTDIDDKIIMRARQQYLVEQYRAQHPHLTKALLDDVQSAWANFFRDTLLPLAPPAPPLEAAKNPELAERERAGEGGWEQVSRMAQDETWRADVSQRVPKFSMWFKTLQTSRDAQIAAAMALGTGDTSSEQAQSLIDASVDILSAHLDATLAHTVSDPAIFRKLAAYWEASFFEDMRRLHVEPPSMLTRVSEYVPEIVAFIQRIIDNGFAYVDDASNESKNVWFATSTFDGGVCEAGTHSYAKLAPWSKGNRELLEEGEGALAAKGKRSAADFALWKRAKPGEPSWPSPWGPGRPGWHIECSVMASEVLGSQIDIHSGGIDLTFPHHDNELAQSEAYHGCTQWINYFLHTGHLHIEGLKMSKSLKNFISIDEALSRYSARQLRMAFLMHPWHVKLDFRESSMAEVRAAESTLNKFFAAVVAVEREFRAKGPAFSDGQHHFGTQEKELMAALHDTQYAFRAAMCDNFDTPKGMDLLLQLVSRANVYERGTSRESINVSVLVDVAQYVASMLRMLGLGEGPSNDGDLTWGTASSSGMDTMSRDEIAAPFVRVLSSFRDRVRQLARSQASAGDLLKLADAIRDVELVDLGVALEDQEDGQALFKFVPAEQLQAQRAEKERMAAEKAERKAAAAAAAKAKRREQLERGRIPPSELFRAPHTSEYSQWDEQGLPTHDKDGEALGKKRRKNIEKEYERQGKLHADYLAAQAAGEID
ncbi:cysteinyl-trna synthetase [Malassezia pachydermatis]|uniref:cysteine--tRNA ligase n=1 Tax=Malassezia pachydermatis TaxID=77020 RepID=A0A0M9VR03_9BASI|nr:cysteinyl-trna synthetase [Malassezia pachydermatis]KOS16083.1 cysteinyl-trna synthetase [Malassezia pachydermatis]